MDVVFRRGYCEDDAAPAAERLRPVKILDKLIDLIRPHPPQALYDEDQSEPGGSTISDLSVNFSNMPAFEEEGQPAPRDPASSTQRLEEHVRARALMSPLPPDARPIFIPSLRELALIYLLGGDRQYARGDHTQAVSFWRVYLQFFPNDIDVQNRLDEVIASLSYGQDVIEYKAESWVNVEINSSKNKFVE